MAKAKQIPCDEPAVDPQSWLAEVLLSRFDEVAGYAKDALKPDAVKGVHNMRVATRRLRSVLRDFEGIINELPAKNVGKDLKKLGDSLGAVRDEDVAIITLEQFSNENDYEKIREGIENMVAERRSIREKAFRHLVKTLSPKTLTELRSRLAAALKKANEQRVLFHPSTIAEAAHEAVTVRSNDLFERGGVIYNPAANKRLHKLRIVAKRLRYAIELFAACLDEAVAPFASEVAQLQGHLGEVHDCDVWIEELGERLKDKDRPNAARDAEAWLLSEFVKKRSKEYRAALDLWVNWEQNGFADRLRVSISES
ncbi:MAG: CHAD domain-containing protein [Pyrinomonadaceae bacterium]